VEIENNNADGSDLQLRFILPVKTVNELYKLFSDGEELVRIHTMRKHLVFYIGDLIFFSRLVDGEYIDFDRIIIQQHKIHADIDKETLLSALERAALITEERVAGSVRAHVKLQLESGLLKILASSAAGSTYDEIEVGHEGGDILIAFNNRFLIDSIRACESERIRIALSSPLTSVNIEPAEGKSEDCEDLFMLLPVRMKD
jgi:DNA polymerase-3 subunit beta